MTKLSDITVVPFSGLQHIDALLGSGPDWNFIGGNTITYTFSTASGNQTFTDGRQAPYSGSVSAFNADQQASTRTALEYVTAVTGIAFKETAAGDQAQMHFASANLNGNYAGWASYGSRWWKTPADEVSKYEANTFVYLDNAEFAAQHAQLPGGGRGYQVLLHEIGHVLGLKHPFEEDEGNHHTLPSSEDHTANTLLSYTQQGGPYNVFSPYDLAALNWLYGGDGLGGNLGIGSVTGGRYLTGSAQADTLAGTNAADVLRGEGGNDVLNGGGGIDTALFAGKRAEFTVAKNDQGYTVSGSAGVDSLVNIERLHFDDHSVALDLNGNGGKVYRLYQAALDRKPDDAGLGFHLHFLDNGQLDLIQTASGFVASPEFTQRYGALNDAQYVNTLYANVLNRSAAQNEIDYHVEALTKNGVSRSQLLVNFSESPENQAQVIGSIQNGFDYIVYTA